MCSLNFPSVVCCCSYLKDKLHWYNRAILSLALLPPTVVLKSPEQAQRLDGIGQTCQFVSVGVAISCFVTRLVIA